MLNPIKYTTGSEALALKSGNFYISTNDVGKGPTSTTGYYNGVDIPSGGYVIYMYNSDLPGNLSYHSSPGDDDLISFTNNLAGESFTTAEECLVYYAGQSDMMCFNRDYENIVTDELVLNLDTGFIPSYPTSGSTWYDLGENSNNGTLTNGPTFDSGSIESLVFDGVDDYVSTNFVFDGYTDFSISIWLKTSSTTRGTVFGSYSGGTGNTNALAVEVNRGATIPETGSVFIFARKGTGSVDNIIAYVSGLNINDNTWHNIVWCVDASTATNTFYMDGVSKTVSITTNNFSSNAFGTFEFEQWIGSLNNEGTAGIFFDGNISNVLVYDKVLSSTEVLQNYNAQKDRFGIILDGLVLNLDAGDTLSYPTSGSTWYDLSGNNYDGTLINGPTFDSGSGGSIVFDGVDDYGNCSTISELTGIYDVSVCAWVKPISNVGESAIVNRYYNTNSNNGWALFGAGIAEPFNFGFGGRENSSAFLSCPTAYKFYYGDWHHVVGVKSGNQWSIYVDGVLENSQSLGSGTVAFLNNVTYLSGYPQFGAARRNNLNLAQVQIYDRALAASEVLYNFNAEKAQYELSKLLDIYPNADVAYSLRKLRTAYTGSAIRVRRASDNAEQDIGFDFSGRLDTSSLTTFCSGTNGFVTTWYDQSGNSNDATQSTAAYQPKIYDSSTGVITENGTAAIQFDGSDDYLSFTRIQNIEGLFAVAYSTRSATYASTLIRDATSNDLRGMSMRKSPGYWNMQQIQGYPRSSSYAISSNASYLMYIMANGTNSQYALNGDADSLVAETDLISSSEIGRYHFQPANYNLQGGVKELIFYPSDPSSNRIGIEANINDYYAIY